MADLPVSVDRLADFLPHRPPMVWVEEVIEVDHTGGSCGLTVRPGAAYLTDGKIRRSAYIEWMAQAFAFVEAYRNPDSRLETAFLVGIRDFEVQDAGSRPGAKLRIRVETVKALEGMVLFRGRVCGVDGRVLASATLKIYARFKQGETLDV